MSPTPEERDSMSDPGDYGEESVSQTEAAKNLEKQLSGAFQKEIGSDPDAIEMHECDSSNIQSHGFRMTDEGKGTGIVQVEFKGSGSVYQYFDVPERVYLGLNDCDSIGSYFSKNIRTVFDYKKVNQHQPIKAV